MKCEVKKSRDVVRLSKITPFTLKLTPGSTMFQVLFRICPKKKTLNGTREKYGEMIKRQKKIRQKWRKIRERE